MTESEEWKESEGLEELKESRELEVIGKNRGDGRVGEVRASEGVGGGGGGIRGLGGVKEVGLERNEGESRRTSHPILSAMRNVAHPLTGHQDVAAQRSKRQSSCN